MSTMGQRLDLQALLEALLESEDVYFQPPASLQMAYPCIVYKRDNMDTQFADNNPYSLTTRYMVTVIDGDPDSVIPKKVALLPQCIYSRSFVAENLNHDVFILYF